MAALRSDQIRLVLNWEEIENIVRCLSIRIDVLKKQIKNPTEPHMAAESVAETVELEPIRNRLEAQLRASQMVKKAKDDRMAEWAARRAIREGK